MIVLSMINKVLAHPQRAFRPEPEPCVRRTAGSLARFNHLVRMVQDEAYAFASYLVGDPVLAQQVTQQAVQAAYQRFDPCRGENGFRGWLLQHVFATASTRRVTGAARTGGQVAQALARLDETSRALLILVDLQDLDYAAAAQVMGMRIDEVKSRLARARRQFCAQVSAGNGVH